MPPTWFGKTFKLSRSPTEAALDAGADEVAEATVVPANTRVPLELQGPSVKETAGLLWAAEKADFRKNKDTLTAYEWATLFLPCLGWLRTYKWKGWFYRDLLAGLSVAVMVIPQGMSYAQNLAYLPQVYGLYGSFIPCILYAMLGSSRQLVVGPVAVTSLLLGSGLSGIFGDFQINPSDPSDALQALLQERYNHAAIQVAFIAGVIYTGIGLLRMGWVVNILSVPVVSGFMTGAAFIILTGQIKYITGQKLPKADNVYQNLKQGGTFIILLVVCQQLGRRVKKLRFFQFLGPLLVCAISIITMNVGKYYVFNAEIPGTPLIKPVGAIPKGMPAFTGGWWLPLYDIQKELVLAVLVCLLDVVESTSIARALAQKNKYKLNFTQELRGLGLANLGGALFNSYTTTGSFSRSAVNNSVGAKTPLAGFITGVTVGLVLLVLTPVFTNMSANVQGAIVIVGAISLFDFHELFYTWRVCKLDCLCWVASFLLTCFLGAELGIAGAVGLSLLLFIGRVAFPSVRSLGRLPGPEGGPDLFVSTTVYANAQAVAPEDGVIVLRVEAPLFFGNAPLVRDTIEARVQAAREGGHNVHALVLDLSTATDFDASACHLIEDYGEELARDGVTLVLASPSEAAVLALHRGGLVEGVGGDNIQATVGEAVARALQIAAPKAAEKRV